MAGLLALPDDLLSSLIAQSLVAKHLPSAIRLTATSKHIRNSQVRLRAEAEKKRAIRWESTTGMVVTNDQRTPTRCGGSWEKTWAVGSLLPTTGKFSAVTHRPKPRERRCHVHWHCDAVWPRIWVEPILWPTIKLYRPSPGCKIEANSDPPEELQALQLYGSTARGLVWITNQPQGPSQRRHRRDHRRRGRRHGPIPPDAQLHRSGLFLYYYQPLARCDGD